MKLSMTAKAGLFLAVAAALAAAPTGCGGRSATKGAAAGGGRPRVELPKGLEMDALWDLTIKLEDGKLPRIRRAWAAGEHVLVVTESPNLLYLVRLCDGKPLWVCEFERPLETAFPPEISADAVMVMSDNRIMRVDRAFGDLVCRLDPECSISARPVLSSWVEPKGEGGEKLAPVYVPGYDGRVWQLQIRRFEREMPNPKPGGAPIVVRRYVASRGWSTGTRAAYAQITAPLVKAGSFIYACTSDGYVMALRDNNGLPAFRIQTQGQVEGGVSISGTRAYFGASDYKLYCIDRLSGEKLWERPTGNVISERPLPDPVDKLVYVVSRNQGLFGIEDKEGKELWQNRQVERLVGVGKRAVYVLGSKKQLLALNKKTGEPLWKASTADLTVFADDEQFDAAGGPVYLLAEAPDNRLVCLVEPGFVPPKPAAAPEKKPEPPKPAAPAAPAAPPAAAPAAPAPAAPAAPPAEKKG